MIFRFVDKNEKEKINIDMPSAHTGKVPASLNGYLSGSAVHLNKETNVMTITIPDEKDSKEAIALQTWIKEVRKERHWTQGELAKNARLSPAYVSQTERGFLVPSENAIASIVAALLFWDTGIGEPVAPQQTTPSDEPVIKQDIRKFVEILLATDDYHRLELVKRTLADIERIESEIDRNSFESGIDLLIKLASSDFENNLKNIKKK